MLPPEAPISGSKFKTRLHQQFYRAWIIRPGYAFSKTLRMMQRYPKTFIATWLLSWATLATFSQIPQVLVSIPDMLRSDSPELEKIRELESEFPVGNPLVILFGHADEHAFANSELCQIKRWLHSVTHGRHDIRNIISPFSIRKAEFSPDGKNLFYPQVIRDICEMNGDSQSAIEKLLKTEWVGLLVSKDGSNLIVELQFSLPKAPTQYGSYEPNLVESIHQTLVAQFPNSSKIKWDLQSSMGFKFHYLKSLTQDGGLNALIGLVILLLMRLVYGTWKSGLLLLFTLSASCGMTLSLMLAFGVPFDMLTSCLFVILTLSATEDFIFLSHMNRNRKPGQSWRTPFRKMLLPSFFTSLTTAIGFGSLYISDILPIQRLGLWTAVGAFAEWFMTLLLLPTIMQVFPRLRNWISPSPTRLQVFFERIGHFFPRPKVALALCSIMIPAAIISSGVTSNDSLDDMWPNQHSFSKALTRMQSHFGWKGTVDIVFDKTLDRRETEQRLEEIAKDPIVTTIESPWRVLDSLQENMPKEIIGLVERELQDSEAFDRYISTNSLKTRVILYLNSLQNQDLLRLKHLVEKVCNDGRCVIVGDLMTLSIFSSEVIRTLAGSFSLSFGLLVIVICCLAIALGKTLWQTFSMLLTSLWGPMVLMATFPLFLGGVNFVTCVFAAVLEGLACDNAIQFMFSSRRGQMRRAVDENQGATMAVTFILFIGSFVYLASDFYQPKILGCLFAAGYLILLIGDVFLLKGLLALERLKVDAEPHS